MAGRKQHYIPQALLRGFKASQTGKHVQVFVFPAGREFYLSSTEGVASQRQFYSDIPIWDEETLDDKITSYENRLASLLDQLRATPHDAHVDSSVAAEVVSHLTVRGAFIRNIFDFGVREMFGGMSTFFNDSASVRRWMGIDRAQPEEVLAAEIDRAVEALREKIPISLPVDLLRRMILFRLREGFDSFYSEQRVVVEDGLAQLKAAMGEVIRNGHGKVLLNNNLVPKERADALATMHWRVHCVPVGDLILPDCVALSFYNSSARSYSAYTVSDHDGPPDHVLLPLSADRLLVGTIVPSENVRVEDFNLAAVPCLSPRQRLGQTLLKECRLTRE